MMSDDLNLPASLERLEISPERCDGSAKPEQKVEGSGGVASGGVCSLQMLSLKDDCPKDNCQCNKKKEREAIVKRVTFKRPILRRSKLNKTAAILRAPLLNVKEHASTCTKCAESNAAATATKVCLSECCSAASPCLHCSSAGTSATAGSVVANPSMRISSSRLGNGNIALGDRVTQGVTAGRFHPVTSGLCSVQARAADSYDSSNITAIPATASSITSSSTATSISTAKDDDDTTIDELASYFDLFVHIPKKMSLMAEMMYI